MLMVNPEGCTKEQVGLAFWPDASTAQVRNSFHVTLHRLRRALGHPEWIETAGERYRLAPSLVWEIDTAGFEKAVTTALKRQDYPALGRVLEVYRGDFSTVRAPVTGTFPPGPAAAALRRRSLGPGEHAGGGGTA